MARFDWAASLPSVLSREQWAMVLVLAGASLLVFPPDQRGVLLVAWVLIALIAAFVLVLVGARIWPGRRV